MNKKKKNSPPPAVSESPFPWNFLIVFLGASWALVILAAFYNHQPFPLTYLLNLLIPADATLLPPWPLLWTYGKGLAWGLAFYLAAIFVGRVTLLMMLPPRKSSLETLVLSGGFGYGLLAYATLLLGVLGYFYKPVFQWGISSLALLGIVWFLRPSERELWQSAFHEKWKTLFSSGQSFLLFLILAFISVTVLVMAFVPELFYDALVYHLGIPNFYLLEHRLAPIEVMTARFPFTVQMLHVIGLALQNEMVTKLTQAFCLLLVMGALLAFGFRAGRPKWGLLSAVLFACIPTVWMNAITSGVDLGVTLFAVLSALCAYAYLDDLTQRRWLLASAVFAGWAMGSKYTAAPAVAAVGLTVGISLFMRKAGTKEIIKSLLIFGGVALIVFSPWMIKNGMETGNPLYPFFSKYFGGTAMEPWRYTILKNENNGIGIGSFKQLLLAPWKLCISERSSLTFQGPLLLGLLPFLFLVRRAPKLELFKPLLIHSGLFLLMAFVMTRLTRYWMPGLPIVCLTAGFGLLLLFENKNFLSRAVGYLILLTGFLFQATWFFLIVHNSYAPREVLLGRQSREDYISLYHEGMNPNPATPMFRYMKESLLPSDRVMIVGDEKIFPIQVRHGFCGVYDIHPLVPLTESAGSAAEVAKKLLDQGFTYMMVNVGEMPRLAGYGSLGFSEPGYKRFLEFWADYCQLAHVEMVPMVQGYKNPVILVKITSAKRPDTIRPIENIFERARQSYLSTRDPMVASLPHP